MATVKKNIYWSSLVSLIQVYTGSVVFIVLAKLISVEDFGVLSFGFSLATIVLVFSDFGLSLMLIKDYPIVKHKNKYIVNTIILKIIISSFSGLLFLFYLIIFYSYKWVIVGGIYVLFAIAASFTVYLQSLLKIQNKFNKYAETAVLYAIVITIIITYHYLYDLNLIQIVVGFLIGKVLQLMWSLFLCKKELFNEFIIEVKLLKKLLLKSWSYAGHNILGIMYFMVDTQMISYFLGAEEVAFYQSVFRVLLILMMVSEIISNVLLPYLSHKFSKSEDVSSLISNFFMFLLILSCSMFLIFTTFKNEIILTLYSKDYLVALPIVLPLSIVLILRTIASIFGNVLTVSNNQKYRVIAVFISLITSVSLNFICIPLYGIIISAWISVFVHTILFSLYFYFSSKELPRVDIINKETFQPILLTVILYIIINVLLENRLLSIIIGVLFWVAYLYVFLIKKGNWSKLKLILNEKGA